MSKPAVPFYIYDLKNRPQYIACGTYKTLVNDIVFLKGLRGALEKAWLSVQIFYPRFRVKERYILQHWSNLAVSVKDPIISALFWQTAWYKNTQFIGGLATDDRRLFVKAYKYAEDASLARQQSDFVQHYFSSHFTIAPVSDIQERLVFYPLLPHVGKSISTQSIENDLLDLNTRHLEIFTDTLKPALDYINLNLPNLLQKAGYLELWHTIRAYLVKCEMIPMVPVHGDVTPWNMFYTDKVLPVLVDYERAGWHVPFYDYWHFLCQPIVLKYQKPELLKRISDVHEKTSLNKTFLQQTALLYLLDQLAYDLHDKDDYPAQQDRLARTTHVRINLITDLMNHLSNG